MFLCYRSSIDERKNVAQVFLRTMTANKRRKNYFVFINTIDDEDERKRQLKSLNFNVSYKS